MRSRTPSIAGHVPPLSNPQTHSLSSGEHAAAKQDHLRSDLWDNRYNKREIETLKIVAQQYGLDPLMREVIMLQGNIYVTATGLQKLAQRDPDYNGCQIEPVVTDWDNNFFVIKASVWKKGCDYPFEDFGDADSSTSTLQGRALFRHAITRARARAIRSAFAVPFCALEELDDETRWKAMQPVHSQKTSPDTPENTGSSARSQVHQQPGMASSIRLPRTYPGKKETEAQNQTQTLSPSPAESESVVDLGLTTKNPLVANTTETLVTPENTADTLAPSENTADTISLSHTDTAVVAEQSVEPIVYLEKKSSLHQQKMIQNYSQQLGWDETALTEFLQTNHGKPVVQELTRRQASNVLDYLVEQLRKNAPDSSIVAPTSKANKKAAAASVQENKDRVPSAVSTEGMQEAIEVTVTDAAAANPVVEVSVATPEEQPESAESSEQTASKQNQWTGEEQKRIGEDILSRMKKAGNLLDLRQEWQLFQGIRGHFSSEWIDQICETKDQRKAVLSAD